MLSTLPNSAILIIVYAVISVDLFENVMVSVYEIASSSLLAMTL